MASASKSPEHRRLIRFERQQCLRLSALTYLLVSMTNTRIYMANSGKTTEQIGTNLAKKRSSFIKVTEGLVRSMLNEFKEYEEPTKRNS